MKVTPKIIFFMLFRFLSANFKFLILYKATNPRFVVLQNNHYFCIGYTSFIFYWFNIEWNMNTNILHI